VPSVRAGTVVDRCDEAVADRCGEAVVDRCGEAVADRCGEAVADRCRQARGALGHLAACDDRAVVRCEDVTVAEEARAAGGGDHRSGDASSAYPGVHENSGAREPDYRFTLANERTFLAYVRTALALDAASVAAMQFLTAVENLQIRRLISIVLAVAGIAASVGAYVRWRANVRAMRRNAPLPPTLMPLGLAASALVVSLAVVALVLFG
jgi:putative membrane protein